MHVSIEFRLGHEQVLEDREPPWELQGEQGSPGWEGAEGEPLLQISYVK